MNKQNEVEKMRHTLSHVLAAAVMELYPTTTFGVGPAIEDGFYYDIDFGEDKITEKDLDRIEKKMRGIIKRGFTMNRLVKKRERALDWADQAGQKYKTELIKDLPKDEEITFYDVYKAVDCVGEKGIFHRGVTVPGYWCIFTNIIKVFRANCRIFVNLLK